MKKLLTIVLIVLNISIWGAVYTTNDPEPFPNSYTHIYKGVGYLEISGPIVQSHTATDGMRYLFRQGVRKIVMELDSPGGSLDVALRILGHMDMYKPAIHFETRAYGQAASAAFIIFLNGDERYIGENAGYLMSHEVSFGLQNPMLPKVPLPPDLEEERQIFQLWSDLYVTQKGSVLCVDEIKKRIEGKSWFIFANEAIELGFAHGYIPNEK